MKSVLLLIIFAVVTCKSQQILPINTPFVDIQNGVHLKDLNNELNPYLGVYKANFNSNEITLFITKQENKLEENAQKSYYADALIIKYIVKNSAGTILQDTKNNNLNIASLYNIDIDSSENTVNFVYTGTNCNIGFGGIKLKKISATQISWEYKPNDIVTTAAKCPPNLDTNIYLPETKDLIFTKQ